MVTVECPWCAEPATVETWSLAEVVCERCAIRVEIAADPTLLLLDHAA
jgi:hypothetical protein